MKPVLEIASQEAITVSNPEATVMTSEIRQLLAKLVPVLWEGQVHHPRLLNALLLPS